MGVGDVPAISRLFVAASFRHGHRCAIAARGVARVRDGRARCESRTGDRRRHRADARARARSRGRGRHRFLHVAHAESPQQQRRTHAVADGRSRRTRRHRTRSEGCGSRRARTDFGLRRSRRGVRHRRTHVGRERSPHFDLVGAGSVAERLEEDSRPHPKQRRRRARDARPGGAASDRHRAGSVDHVESAADAPVVHGDREAAAGGTAGETERSGAQGEDPRRRTRTGVRTDEAPRRRLRSHLADERSAGLRAERRKTRSARARARSVVHRSSMRTTCCCSAMAGSCCSRRSRTTPSSISTAAAR